MARYTIFFRTGNPQSQELITHMAKFPPFAIKDIAFEEIDKFHHQLKTKNEKAPAWLKGYPLLYDAGTGQAQNGVNSIMQYIQNVIMPQALAAEQQQQQQAMMMMPQQQQVQPQQQPTVNYDTKGFQYPPSQLQQMQQINYPQTMQQQLLQSQFAQSPSAISYPPHLQQQQQQPSPQYQQPYPQIQMQQQQQPQPQSQQYQQQQPQIQQMHYPGNYGQQQPQSQPRPSPNAAAFSQMISPTSQVQILGEGGQQIPPELMPQILAGMPGVDPNMFSPNASTTTKSDAQFSRPQQQQGKQKSNFETAYSTSTSSGNDGLAYCDIGVGRKTVGVPIADSLASQSQSKMFSDFKSMTPQQQQQPQHSQQIMYNQPQQQQQQMQQIMLYNQQPQQQTQQMMYR